MFKFFKNQFKFNEEILKALDQSADVMNKMVKQQEDLCKKVKSLEQEIKTLKEKQNG